MLIKGLVRIYKRWLQPVKQVVDNWHALSGRCWLHQKAFESLYQRRRRHRCGCWQPPCPYCELSGELGCECVCLTATASTDHIVDRCAWPKSRCRACCGNRSSRMGRPDNLCIVSALLDARLQHSCRYLDNEGCALGMDTQYSLSL